MFPQNSVYAKLLNDAILQFSASGLDLKIANDMAWDLQRSDTKQLQDQIKAKTFSMNDIEERKLNLADTEGMFLLMAIGYIIAGSVLVSEIVGGCVKSCRAFVRRGSMVAVRRASIISQSLSELQEPKTFIEKLKQKIRRRLRSKLKPEETENQDVSDEIIEVSEAATTVESSKIDEMVKPENTGLKGITSFCTIKRIMLMRKRRKEEKKLAKQEQQIVATIDCADVDQTCLQSNLNSADEAVGGSHVIIENEKAYTVEDAGNFTETSSIYSDSPIIREETEAEVNLCVSMSDREDNPSTEFGEVV